MIKKEDEDYKTPFQTTDKKFLDQSSLKGIDNPNQKDMSVARRGHIYIDTEDSSPA